MKKIQIALYVIMPVKRARMAKITIVLSVQTGWNKTEVLQNETLKNVLRLARLVFWTLVMFVSLAIKLAIYAQVSMIIIVLNV